MIYHAKPLGVAVNARESLFAIVLVIIAIAFASVTARSQPTPRTRDLAVLAVGRINPDCWPDTVFGAPDAAYNYLPRYIAWGQAPSTRARNDRERDSLAGCASRTSAGRRTRRTELRFPRWENLAGSVTIAPVNRSDDYLDLLITLHGTVPAIGRDQRTEHDSLITMVLFGQSGLDSAAVIDLDGVRGLHRGSVTVLELRPNAELRDPRRRDMTGRTSWELAPVDVTFPDADTAAPRAGGTPDDHAGPALNDLYPSNAPERSVAPDNRPAPEHIPVARPDGDTPTEPAAHAEPRD